MRLKPCPNPRCSGGRIDYSPRALDRVYCTGCQMTTATLEDWNALPRTPANSELVERLQDATENLLIAIGMRWDLDGVVNETIEALTAMGRGLNSNKATDFLSRALANRQEDKP